MKLKVLWEEKGIIFDNVTMELEDGNIIDTEHYDKKINILEVKDAWGYICEDCAKEHNIDIMPLGEIIEGMVCYGVICKETHKVYEISFSRMEIDNFEILYTNEINVLEQVLNNLIKEYEYKFLFSYKNKNLEEFYMLQDLQEKNIVYLTKSKSDLCDFFIKDLGNKMDYRERDNKEFAVKQKEVIRQLEDLKRNMNVLNLSII